MSEIDAHRLRLLYRFPSCASRIPLTYISSQPSTRWLAGPTLPSRPETPASAASKQVFDPSFAHLLCSAWASNDVTDTIVGSSIRFPSNFESPHSKVFFHAGQSQTLICAFFRLSCVHEIHDGVKKITKRLIWYPYPAYTWHLFFLLLCKYRYARKSHHRSKTLAL